MNFILVYHNEESIMCNPSSNDACPQCGKSLSLADTGINRYDLLVCSCGAYVCRQCLYLLPVDTSVREQKEAARSWECAGDDWCEANWVFTLRDIRAEQQYYKMIEEEEYAKINAE